MRSEAIEHTARLVRALKHAGEMLQKLTASKVSPASWGPSQQIAAGALLRVRGLANAIALLLENGFALECEPIVRALIETAINVAWIGTNDARAQAFMAES